MVNSIILSTFALSKQDLIMYQPKTTYVFEHSSSRVRQRVFDILKENNIEFGDPKVELTEELLSQYPYIAWSYVDKFITFYSGIYHHCTCTDSPEKFLNYFGLTYTEQEPQTTKPTVMEQTPFYKTAKEFDAAYSAKSQADKSFEEFLVKYNEMFEKKEYVYCIGEDDMSIFLKHKLENAGFIVHKKETKYGYIYFVSFRQQLIEDYLEYSQIY